MSIAAVQQVYEETRRLSVAGSGLSAGDFRLKKLVEPLEKSAAKAPVFGRVAEAVRKVVDGPAEGSATALLELGTLTTAILYTQGETAVPGDLKPLPTRDLGLTSGQTSARLLKPLLEALSSTGSGRLELIRDAFGRGEFKDLRLVAPAVKALGDPYPEIADFIATSVLPLYGVAILSDLRDAYEKKGKGVDARRLKLMQALDPVGTKPLVTEALEEGSKEVKLAAIECLGGDVEAIPFLLDQAKARATEVRQAALTGLCQFDKPEVVEVLFAALAGDDVALVASHILKCPYPAMSDRVLSEAKRRRDEVLGGKGKSKDAAKEAARKGKLLNQFHALLSAFAATATPVAVEFLREVFRDREQWAKAAPGVYSADRIVEGAARALLLTGSPEGLSDLAAAASRSSPALLGDCFLAAAFKVKPAVLFDQFAPIYKQRPQGKSKAATEAYEKSEAIADELRQIVEARTMSEDSPYRSALNRLRGTIQLDERWLDVAIAIEDLDTVLRLARPDHGGVRKYLLALAKKEVAAKTFEPLFGFEAILRLLVHDGVADVPAIILEAIRKADPSKWVSMYRLRETAAVIPLLPVETLPTFEALLPTLESKIQDMVIGYVDALKQKAG